MPYYIKKKAAGKKTASRTAIERLDKIFSLYIRLRDSRAFGFKAFKCISCGQVKPFRMADCGHYFSRRHMSTRYDEDNCNSECSYCLTPEALVLTSDLRWVKLGEVKVGDVLFGFNEYNKYKTSRRYETSTVTHIHREIRPLMEVTLENGDVIKTTQDHQWLARARGGVSYQWIKTKDLWVNGVNVFGKRKSGPHTENVTTVVCKPFLIVKQDESYESGWIAGMIDADGHITQQNIHNPDGTIRYGLRVGVAQSDKYVDICERIISCLEKFSGNNKPCRQTMDNRRDDKKNGIRSNYQTFQYLLTGTNVEKLQFLMRVRPKKLSKLDVNKIGKLKSQYDTKVKSVRTIGVGEIVVMETSSHTFIANGYAMHNCNRFNAEHLEGYRENLIKKIGQQRFDLLKVKSQQTCKLGKFEIDELYKYYKQETEKILKIQ